jgi:hypothetical protein
MNHDILASSFHHMILDREMLGMLERNIVVILRKRTGITRDH